MRRLQGSVLALSVGMLGCGGGTVPPRHPDVEPPSPVEDAPMTEPADADQETRADDDDAPLPAWVLGGRPHPVYRAPAYRVAVASDRREAVADSVARARVRADVLDALDGAQAAAQAVHAYFSLGEDFAGHVAGDLRSSGGSLAVLDSLIRIAPETRGRYLGAHYALAYLDADEAEAVLGARAAEMRARVVDACDRAEDAYRGQNWFEFARWSRAALGREADRIAIELLAYASDRRAAAAPDSARGARWMPEPRLLDLRPAALQMMDTHGWSLDVVFDWPPDTDPRPLEPRIRQRLMQYLLDMGLHVGLGSGCPQPIPSEDGVTFEPPPPHHILHVAIAGAQDRLVGQGWRATLTFDVRASTCDAGVVVTERRAAELASFHPRDPDAAMWRVARLADLESSLDEALSRVDLIIPAEVFLGVAG